MDHSEIKSIARKAVLHEKLGAKLQIWGETRSSKRDGIRVGDPLVDKADGPGKGHLLACLCSTEEDVISCDADTCETAFRALLGAGLTVAWNFDPFTPYRIIVDL